VDETPCCNLFGRISIVSSRYPRATKEAKGRNIQKNPTTESNTVQIAVKITFFSIGFILYAGESLDSENSPVGSQSGHDIQFNVVIIYGGAGT
jgi:hypothetical protein